MKLDIAHFFGGSWLCRIYLLLRQLWVRTNCPVWLLYLFITCTPDKPCAVQKARIILHRKAAARTTRTPCFFNLVLCLCSRIAGLQRTNELYCVPVLYHFCVADFFLVILLCSYLCNQLRCSVKAHSRNYTLKIRARSPNDDSATSPSHRKLLPFRVKHMQAVSADTANNSAGVFI